MRTNIDINDELMAKAIQVSGATTKKDVVEEGLRLLVRLKAQEGIRKWRGKLQWEGDLSASRQGRFLDWDKSTEDVPRDLSSLFETAE